MAGKKIMMVVPPTRFDGQVFDLVRRVLVDRGNKVDVTSIVYGAATSDDGMTVPIEARIHEIKTYEYDAYIFVGGEGVTIYFDDDRARKLADDIKYKTVGAIGNGAAVILAMAGLLKEKRATSPYQYAGLLEEHGAIYTGLPVEADGKVVTLQDSALGEQFVNALLRAMES